MLTHISNTAVLVVALAGVASAAIDLRVRRVPNWMTLAIASTGLALAATHAGSATGITGITFRAALAGFVIGFVLMLPGHLIGATGAGDVKLFAALGTLLGPAGTVTAFLYTALAGGLLACVVAVRRRVLADTVMRTAALVATAGGNLTQIEDESRNNRFAYAPAIAIGTLAAALGL